MDLMTFPMRVPLFLLLVAIGLPLPSARACEPHPDYWFREAIEFAKVSLPEGITVYQPGMELPEPPPQGVWLSAADPAQTLRASIEIVNQTAEPLYLLSLRYREVLVMATPDPLYEQRVNLAHEVASYLVVAGTRQSLSLPIEALLDLDAGLQDPNVRSINPPDPAALLPPAQHSELLLVFKGQVIVVPFSITYRLNENFDNGRCDEGQADVTATAAAQATTTQPVTQAEQAPQDYTLAFGLLALVLIALLFYFFARLLHRENSGN
jgi:hypothetical protein